MHTSTQDISGDMAAAFYADVPPASDAAVAGDVERMLRMGELPAGAPSVAHYLETVRWHRRGDASDAELVLVALLVSLAAESGARHSRELLQGAGAADRAEVERWIGDRPLRPLLERVRGLRLRRIKDMARLALLGWAAGTHPGVLVMGRVGALELLEAQARGVRPVGVGLPTPGFDAVDRAYPGGFTHHDLCHLAKFRGPADSLDVYAGQVGFFAAFARAAALDPSLLESPPGTPAGYDLSLVATDTNGDAKLLITLFLERFVASNGTGPETARVAEGLLRLGLPPAEAARLAPLFRSDRTRFVRETAPGYVSLGLQALTMSTNLNNMSPSRA